MPAKQIKLEFTAIDISKIDKTSVQHTVQSHGLKKTSQVFNTRHFETG